MGWDGLDGLNGLRVLRVQEFQSFNVSKSQGANIEMNTYVVWVFIGYLPGYSVSICEQLVFICG
jgi:hypothetical protein